MKGSVRVGVIGTGYGRHHVRALKAHPGVVVEAICSTDQARAEADARELGIPAGFGDYRKMLESAPIDAVCVTTNPASHVEICEASFRAGKHVLCTKPIGANLREARHILDIARTSGLVHGVDQHYRYNPVTFHAKSMIAAGAIGSPLSAVSSLYFGIADYYGNPRASPNKNAWFSSSDRGGGFLLADAPHQFDRLLWYFGPVKTVVGHSRTAFKKVAATDGKVYDCDSDDTYHALFEFESGLLAAVMFNPTGWSGSLRHLEVHGESGSMLLEGPGWDQSIRIGLGSEKDWKDVPIPVQLTAHDLPQGVTHAIYALFDRFVAAIAGGEPMSPSFEEGYKTQELIEAVLRSDASGSRQTLPLPWDG
ncbi:MAG: Gfo/Idh/MocA family oxidoreductase [Verrucomicrobia bacterium]|nr:Gfo/Idh/MocA family oxidoreductase [Verrucomicrobiota bacterium]